MSNYYKQEDLDSALSELLVSPYANEDTQFSCGVKDALKLLRDVINENVPDCLRIPAADVVEVVRCKDCKHRPISTIEGEDYGFSLEPPDDDWRCPCLNGDDGWYSWMPEDDFYCADGERRTEDG